MMKKVITLIAAISMVTMLAIPVAFSAPTVIKIAHPNVPQHPMGQCFEKLKELVEKSGGRIEIRNIKVGDPTMSVLEIYVAEYQERAGLLYAMTETPRRAVCCRTSKRPPPPARAARA